MASRSIPHRVRTAAKCGAAWFQNSLHGYDIPGGGDATSAAGTTDAFGPDLGYDERMQRFTLAYGQRACPVHGDGGLWYGRVAH